MALQQKSISKLMTKCSQQKQKTLQNSVGWCATLLQVDEINLLLRTVPQ